MAVYYKFKSAKDFHSISVDSPFISIFQLKERIIESKYFGKGKVYDLVITDAQTNEDYLDEDMLIPKNTSVIIRRIPGPPCKTIVTQPDKLEVEDKVESDQSAGSSITAIDSSGFIDGSEWDDFGADPFATDCDTKPGQSNNPVQESVPLSKTEEDNKIKALVKKSGLEWQIHHTDRFGQGRTGGWSGRGFGHGALGCKTPPQGYICHRCKVPGHFIQHCPTNGDPSYDIKKVRPPTGVPKSMLVPSQDGSYALPSGTAAVLQPNEAAFEKEMEGLSSTRSMENLPPELQCPLCKEVMKDAVLTSKCCFESFCDKCIRDSIITKSVCACGARGVLADDLLPNMTLRDTIKRILESGSSSSSNRSGSASQVQDMDSVPTQSAASEGDQMVPSGAKETKRVKENMADCKPDGTLQQQIQPQTSGKVQITKVPDVSESTRVSVSVKETVSAVPVEKEGQQKVAVVEAGKKKKRKKVSCPANDMEWMAMQPYIEGYADPSVFNPCWPGMQTAMNGFMDPFGINMPYNMGYCSVPFGNFVPSDPFGRTQGFMMPAMFPPHSSDCYGNGDYGREANQASNNNVSVPPVQMKHKQQPARRTPNEELSKRHNDSDRDSERKRSSVEHYSKSERKKSSPNHDRDSDRGSHRSTEHTSHHSGVHSPTLKRKFQHHELDHHRTDQSHYNNQSRSKSSSSRRQPSESILVSSDQTRKERAFSRLGFEEHSKRRRQECVLLAD